MSKNKNRNPSYSYALHTAEGIFMINSHFNSVCCVCGRKIKVGDCIWWCKETSKAQCEKCHGGYDPELDGKIDERTGDSLNDRPYR